MLAIYWPRLTLPGAASGMLAGLISSLLIIWFSPLVQIGVLHHASAPFPLNGPALVTIPLAFIVSIVVSLLTQRGTEPAAYAAVESCLIEGWRTR